MRNHRTRRTGTGDPNRMLHHRNLSLERHLSWNGAHIGRIGRARHRRHRRYRGART
jgi:hypothetical protein